MKKQKAYVSGQITGLPASESAAIFAEAAEFLQRQGYEVVNPVELCREFPTGTSWIDYMREDVKALVECDLVVMLPNWSKSRGAQVEYRLASGLGIRVLYFQKGSFGHYLVDRNSLPLLFDAVQKVTGVDMPQLLSQERTRPMPDARKIFSIIAKEHIGMRVSEIGRIINCDHATVLTQVKEGKALMETDKTMRQWHTLTLEAYTNSTNELRAL